MRSFSELRSYQLASELADELWDQVVRWPKFQRWSVGIQLTKAADSVGANIAEASGRWGQADQRRFLHIARASLYETEHWIERARIRGLLETGAYTERLAEVGRTLNGMIARSRALDA